MKKLSIGKVSKIADLPQSVIRYWETVFEQLDPEKSDGGTRMYSQSDIDMILEIKNLLYNKKFTIAGAQSTLSNHAPIQGSIPDNNMREQLIEIRDEIDEILKDLADE